MIQHATYLLAPYIKSKLSNAALGDFDMPVKKRLAKQREKISDAAFAASDTRASPGFKPCSVATLAVGRGGP